MDMESKKEITQYFSKWRKCWVPVSFHKTLITKTKNKQMKNLKDTLQVTDTMRINYDPKNENFLRLKESFLHFDRSDISVLKKCLYDVIKGRIQRQQLLQYGIEIIGK